MYTLEFAGATLDPADATTYVVSSNPNQTPIAIASIASIVRHRIHRAGTVIGARVTVLRLGTAPDAVDLSLVASVRVNVADTAIETVAMAGGAAPITTQFVNSALAVAVAAGDDVSIHVLTPTWATTNPTQLFISGVLYITDTAENTAGGVLTGTYPAPAFAADMATQAELDAHINDVAAAHAASAISNVAAGGIAATDLQAAVNELDTEKATVVALAAEETARIATDTTLTTSIDNHVWDAVGAHAASAISNVAAGGIAATQLQAAINELDTEKATVVALAATQAEVDAEEIARAAADTTLQGNINAHLADAVGAHAASAISNTPAGEIAAITVQAAIDETAGDVEAIQLEIGEPFPTSRIDALEAGGASTLTPAERLSLAAMGLLKPISGPPAAIGG